MKNIFKIDRRGLLKLYIKCRFSGVGFDDEHEIGECSIAIQIIPFCNNVIELGGGWGKVSHMINQMLARRNKQTQHIVVERSKGMINKYLIKNKKLFNDKYTIVHKPANKLIRDDFSILKESPDCLYVDCEGCLFEFQRTKLGRDLLKNDIRFIINEMDGNNRKIIKQWKKYGFKRIAQGYGCVDKCITEVWYKNKSRRTN